MDLGRDVSEPTSYRALNFSPVHQLQQHHFVQKMATSGLTCVVRRSFSKFAQLQKNALRLRKVQVKTERTRKII